MQKTCHLKYNIMHFSTALYCYLDIGVRAVDFPQHEIARKVDAVIPEYKIDFVSVLNISQS